VGASRILSTIESGSNSAIGARIDAENIDSWLAGQRRIKDDFRRTHPLSSKNKTFVERSYASSPWFVAPVVD